MTTFLPLLRACAATMKTLLETFRNCTCIIICAPKQKKNSVRPVPKPPSRHLSIITSESPKENSPPPISRLQLDLLAIVVSESLPPGWPLARYKRLTELSLVCIQWHDVIEANPQIWCVVSHGLPQPLLLKILSKSALLDVTIKCRTGPLPWEDSWLQSHRRWKRLNLTCATAVTNRLVTVLNPLALESVSIYGRFGRMEQIAHFATSPALRELCLDGVVMDWDTFPYTGLEVLELNYGRGLRPAESHVSLLQLIAILDQNSQLRVLRLNSVYPNIDGMDEHTPIPQVDLPRLERLELKLPCRQGLFVLNSINCRPGASTQLKLAWRDGDNSDTLTLKAAAAVVQKATPVIRQATTSTVALIRKGVMLTCQHTDCLTGFELTLSGFPLEHALHFVHLLTKCLPHPIPLSLSITWWRTEFDNDEAFGAIAGLPNVRKVRISYTGVICPFTRRLGLPLPSRGDDEVRWPFPRMSCFSYERGDCTVKHVAQILQARYSARKPGGGAEFGTGEEVGANMPSLLDSLTITEKKLDEDGESRLLLETLIGKERITYL